jgi:hypothetical protein
MGCVNCGGPGCDECNNSGTINITGCPVEVIPSATWDLIEILEMWENGTPPILAGSLGQMRAAVVAYRTFTQTKARYKSEF